VRSAVFKTVTPPDANPDEQTSLRQIDERPSLPHLYGTPELIPELAEIVAAWDRLTEAVRAGIVAMVRTASGKD
jgi:hypothetical protein